MTWLEFIMYVGAILVVACGVFASAVFSYCLLRFSWELYQMAGVKLLGIVQDSAAFRDWCNLRYMNKKMANKNFVRDYEELVRKARLYDMQNDQ